MPRLRPFAVIVAALVLLCAGSRAADLRTHTILVVNQGNEAIFALRFGHDATPPVWSADVLPFDQVIDVSEGREISISVDPAECTADLQAGYRDAHAIVIKDVDLCTTDRVNFQH